VKRPADLFDREVEWDDLTQFLTQPGPGIRLGLVRGRRRQGKSFMLRRLVRQHGGFYYQAAEEDRGQALDGFGRAFGEFLQVPGGRLGFSTWADAMVAIAQLPSAKKPHLIVLDEFPYLLGHSPELPSVLQRMIDASTDSGPSIRLIVCGSALSTMASLLTGTKALRGRASLDLVVQPFDFRTSAAYWGIDDFETAFTLHAILGGTPGYRDLLPALPPKRIADVPRWLASGPLNPSSTLFREDDYLLTEERALTDRALYHSVVAEIAKGQSTQGGIAKGLAREQPAVQYPLAALEESGFVVRSDDVLRDRRPIYTLADPIIRFHHVITRPNLARFEDRDTSVAWAASEPSFRSHVLGPHFEDLARDFIRRFASPATIGGQANRVGASVVNDSADRSQHQIDVVAVGQELSGARRVLALGEAKYTAAKQTIGELNHLDVVRHAVSKKHPSAASARLLLFSARGFETQLRKEAQRRGDVELIDLERMYTGD
jgi:uncharacterized protein